MKEPFFNDVSIYPLCESDAQVECRIRSFVEVLKFCGFLGFSRIRYDRSANEIELKKGFYLKDYLLHNARGNDNGAQLILSTLRPPYIDNDTIAEERYLTHTIRLLKGDLEVDAYGFASAFCTKSFLVGFSSEDFWNNNYVFSIAVDNDITKNRRLHKIFCVSTLQQFSMPPLVEWIVDEFDCGYRDAKIRPDLKNISLRDDHGKDILQKFSQALRKEPYVVEILNSLPFNNNARRMTKWLGDGVLEIRLLHERHKIGVAVKITAQNDLEAIYLAAAIEKKYR